MQQGTVQANHHSLLHRRKHSLQAIGSVRAVPKDSALLPLVDSLLGNAKALSQHSGSLVTGRDLGTHGRRSACVLVQGYHSYGRTPQLDCKDSNNSCRTALAMKSG